MRHLLALSALVLVGCEWSDPSCRRACNDVEDWAEGINFNQSPRLTRCDELCAHPVARSFERCCAQQHTVEIWFGCEEAATGSVRLTDTERVMWEWALTAITYDATSDLVRIESVMALSAGATGCTPDPVVALAHEFPAATGDATGHEPVTVTPIPLQDYETAKWDAIMERYEWNRDLPGLGHLTGGTADFEEGFIPTETRTTTFISIELPGGAHVSWMLWLPLCQAP